ncbi:MAG: class I SAM-dependent methyltransferase [Candidatus Bathyarchaeia archaeon]
MSTNRSILKKLKRFLLKPIAGIKIAYTIIRLKRVKLLRDEIDDWMNLAFNFNALGIRIKPIQIPYEIKGLLEIIKKLNPKNVLEIGTASGGTLFLFSRASSPDATIVSVDLPGGPFGGGYSKGKALIFKSFARAKQKIYLLRADSHNHSTLEKIKFILLDKKLDFLFIDGDHSYEGVKKDFETYSPLVRNGGIIAFHDIVPGDPKYVGGVPKFWKEIKPKFNHTEIVENRKQSGCGIGVIYT